MDENPAIVLLVLVVAVFVVAAIAATLTGGDVNQVRETAVAIGNPLVLVLVGVAFLWMLGQR